jgi:two-component system, LuxR family, response regulator FixJ
MSAVSRSPFPVSGVPPQPVIHVIDDDNSLRRAVSRLLSAAGHRVQTYASAGEFLAAHDGHATGCLILDVRLPGMSGLELQEELSRRGNPVPIVFLSGHGDIPMSVRAIKAGAVDFLTKPVQRGPLLEAVKVALARNAARLKKH